MMSAVVPGLSFRSAMFPHSRGLYFLRQDKQAEPAPSAHIHVCNGIPANIHLDTVDRRRARAVKLIPLRAAPIQISSMFGHSEHAQMLSGRAQHPYASRARNIDISMLVAFHAVDDSALEAYGC